MTKIIQLLTVVTAVLSAWETNTHRAIDRAAILYSKNLQTFLSRSGVSNRTYRNSEITFDSYGMTYIQYIMNGEKNGISEWKHVFQDKYGYSAKPAELIEAGTILEDAQWNNAIVRVQGRFNNHFYDPQNGGHALTVGVKPNVNALKWVMGDTYHTGVNYNYYSFNDAYDYFYKGFTESDPAVRRKYQAKMLVAVGHLMHMVNDMTSTAHTRGDSHPEGDIMEVWGRGGKTI